MGTNAKEYITPHETMDDRRRRKISDIIFPYPNLSSFYFNFWNKRGDKKTKEDRKFIQGIITDPDFSNKDVRGVNFNKIDDQLAKDMQSPWGSNGWKSSSVTVEIPTGKKQTKAVRKERAQATQDARRHGEVDPEADEFPVHRFKVDNIRHRSLVHVLRSAVEDDHSSRGFHWHGFQEHWQPPDPESPPERVYGELYTSQAFLDAERDLLSSPPEDGCTLPRVIAAYMFWSDATLVAQFGLNKVWPIYLFFGNLSKYVRCRPSARAAHHVAFLPSVRLSLRFFP